MELLRQYGYLAVPLALVLVILAKAIADGKIKELVAEGVAEIDEIRAFI